MNTKQRMGNLENSEPGEQAETSSVGVWRQVSGYTSKRRNV